MTIDGLFRNTRVRQAFIAATSGLETDDAIASLVKQGWSEREAEEVTQCIHICDLNMHEALLYLNEWMGQD